MVFPLLGVEIACSYNARGPLCRSLNDQDFSFFRTALAEGGLDSNSIQSVSVFFINLIHSMNSPDQNITADVRKGSASVTDSDCGLLASRAGLVILLFYVVTNAALLLVVEESAQLLNGADAGTWHNPALALLKYGALVELDNPATPMTYRQPLYPLFDAALLWLGGGKSLIPIIVGQVMVLWITGLFARAMVNAWLPGYGLAALALVVFNPNAVATAHLIQSDTLYSLLITAALWAVLRYAREPSLRPALLAGLFLGLSCLVRPAAQYLILLLPLLLPILALAGGCGRPFAARVGQGVVAMAMAAMLVVPWMAHNAKAGKGFSLSPPVMMLAYAHVHVAYLEKYASMISLAEAHGKISAMEEAYVASWGAEWEGMSASKREKILTTYYIHTFFSYDLSVITKATAYGWGQFFGAAGAANFHNLLGLDAPSAFTAMREKNFESHFGSVIDALKRSSAAAVTISVMSLMFVIVLRALGLIGLAWMFMRRHYAVLLSCAGLIAYFAVFHLFIGNSRYRLPMEPALIFLALYGVDGLRARLRREG